MLLNKPVEMRSFPRRLASLAAIAEFTDSYLSAIPASLDDTYAVHLAIEELFTNMLKHSRGGGEEVTIGFALTNGRLTVSLIDYSVDAWDPRLSQAVDVSVPVDERRPGKLGLHLVKTMFTEIDYRYENGNSTITLGRKLTADNV